MEPAAPAPAAWLRPWLERSVADLGRARSTIDAMNVFPVPDGDTGTNMYLTVEAAATALPAAAGAGDWAAMARGALLGARGNSGVILAEYLRALAAALADPVGHNTGQVGAGHVGAGEPAAAGRLAAALGSAAAAARAAVVRPVDGTILTVAAAAGEAAARESARGSSQGAVAQAAATAAHAALGGTPQQLPVLAAAGVLDAGGAGLTVLLDALARVTGARPVQRLNTGPDAWPDGAPHGPPHGRPDEVPDEVPDEMPDEVRWQAWVPARVPTGVDRAPAAGYEVMLLLAAASVEAFTQLRAELAAIGDSLVFVGDADLASVHVHVPEAGPAIEAAYRAGAVSRLRVTWLGGELLGPVESRSGRTVVATAHGPGTLTLLQDAGAAVVPVAARARPAVGDLVAAARQAAGAEVVLLPGDRESIPAAEAAAGVLREEGLRSVVIPTRSIVQTLAALGVHDPQRPFDDDVVAMSRAAAATRYGALTLAERQAVTTAGICEPGDVLGVIDADVVEIGQDLARTATAVAVRLLATGGEIVTLVTGADCPNEVVAAVTLWCSREHPAADVVLIPGGQPLWPLIIGVE